MKMHIGHLEQHSCALAMLCWTSYAVCRRLSHDSLGSCQQTTDFFPMPSGEVLTNCWHGHAAYG